MQSRSRDCTAHAYWGGTSVGKSVHLTVLHSTTANTILVFLELTVAFPGILLRLDGRATVLMKRSLLWRAIFACSDMYQHSQTATFRIAGQKGQRQGRGMSAYCRCRSCRCVYRRHTACADLSIQSIADEEPPASRRLPTYMPAPIDVGRQNQRHVTSFATTHLLDLEPRHDVHHWRRVLVVKFVHCGDEVTRLRR